MMEPHSRPCSSQNGTLRLPRALVSLLTTCLAGPTSDRVTQTDTGPALADIIRNSAHHIICLFRPLVTSDDLQSSLLVGMVKLAAVCGLGSAFWLWSKRDKNGAPASIAGAHPADDAASTDPGLLRKHSTVRSYTVLSDGVTYPAIRTFYRPHPQESKLPSEPCPVPLLVFIHGLGGSVAQFNPILLSLSNLASCLAIDLPGCGLSSFEPTAWGAYTSEALVGLLAVVIESHRLCDQDQQVVLVGHSMGCSLATLLASPTSPHAGLVSPHVVGLIAICPQADPPTPTQVKALHKLTSLPVPIFDLLRKWDRRKGVNSNSVLRMTGRDAEDETKRLQLRYNKQSRSATWQRMAWGMCPKSSRDRLEGGLPGRVVWAGLKIPVFLAGGEADHVTSASNVKRIVEFLGRDVTAVEPPSEKASLPIAAAPFDPAIVDEKLELREHQDSAVDTSDLPKHDEDAKTVSTIESYVATEDGFPFESMTTADGPLVNETSKPATNNPLPHPRRLVVKTAIMPKPAAHSLLFAPSTSRIISGLIGSFFADHVDPRLSLAWQLQYLSTEGKWDVKNLEKWRAVCPVSEPIAKTFRAMKTLREVDETHTPIVLAKRWAGKICAVVDISHDNPVYDPQGLEANGIPYHKFPTVSKQPPQPEEVQTFIELVDKIRAEGKEGLIAVHCHYGFNRTGFFLVSYLIERLGYRVEDAIEEFGQKRSPGIRHSHFIDALHVRYARGLARAPTL